MEPKLEGFCRGCNAYSKELQVCIAKNNNTDRVEVNKFCPECRARFKLKSIFGMFGEDKEKDGDHNT